MPEPAAAEADRDAARWLAGLLWAPALLLIATAAAGVSLRNHWGVQMFQFASLWIAWRWQRRAAIDLRRLAWIVAALHAVLLVAYAVQHLSVRIPDDGRHRLDTIYPAQGLARAVAAEWQAAAEGCPLRYVGGSVYPAGLAALYGATGAEVYESRVATPWIDSERLARSGRVVVADSRADVPAAATRVRQYAYGTVEEPRAGRTFYIAAIPPSAPCR